MEMNRREDSALEAAAVSYISSCLVGKAWRLKKKKRVLSHREQNILNTKPFVSGTEERIDLIVGDHSFESETVNRLLIQQAAKQLSVRETNVIWGVYVQDKKIKELSHELRLSTRTIIRIKQKALTKMREEMEQD